MITAQDSLNPVQRRVRQRWSEGLCQSILHPNHRAALPLQRATVKIFAFVIATQLKRGNFETSFHTF